MVFYLPGDLDFCHNTALQPMKNELLKPGNVVITDCRSKLSVIASQDTEGRHQPDLVYQLFLSGINTEGDPIHMADIRFRDAEKIVTNPAAVGNQLIIDMLKTDYAFMQMLLAKTLDAPAGQQGRLVLQYQQHAHSNEFNISFRID